ncbi:MAG: hypothetical protein AAB791_02790 [Patescibacteria group bacterium]
MIQGKNVKILLFFTLIIVITACTNKASLPLNNTEGIKTIETIKPEAQEIAPPLPIDKNTPPLIQEAVKIEGVIKDEPKKEPDCHPSYSGCLDPNASDYDCVSGSGNGPYYTGKVQVIGPDVFDLDRDHDGWGCE